MVIRKEKEVDITEENIKELYDAERKFTVCLGDNVTYYKVDKASERGLRRIAKVEYKGVTSKTEISVIQIINKSFGIREILLCIEQKKKKSYIALSVVNTASKLTMTEIVELLYKEADKGRIEWGAVIAERILTSYFPFVLCVICITVISIYLLFWKGNELGIYIALILNMSVVLGYIVQMLRVSKGRKVKEQKEKGKRVNSLEKDTDKSLS